MKNSLFLTSFLFLCAYAFGQARDGTRELQQTTNPEQAAVIYLPYSPQVFRHALTNYLSKTRDKEKGNGEQYLLSSNTLLVKTNVSNADMHFLVGLKDPANKNETVVYLKLKSSFPNENYTEFTDVQFNMQQAKDYLDNLAVAIEPYASKLQLKLQQRTLSDAWGKDKSLVIEGNKLEEKRKKIKDQIDTSANSGKDKGLAKRKIKNDRLIDANLAARENLSNDITKQIVALALLTD